MKYRTFRFMFADDFHGVYDHRSGELVGRKPVIMSFLNQRPKAINGRISASIRMGKGLLGKLERLGIK